MLIKQVPCTFLIAFASLSFHNLLIKKDDISEETLNELPETKALSLISEIYDADEKLKTISAEERKEQRDLTVRPLVEKFYSFIESIDENELNMRSRLKMP